MSPRLTPARGFSLMELMMVIVVLGIAAGSVMTASVKSSEMSAVMLREQRMLAVASALLEEVNSKPFTYCDPSDGASVVSAAQNSSAAQCPTPELLGPEGGETRLGPAGPRFDNVTDYNNYTMPGLGCTSLCDSQGTQLDVAASGAMAGCSAAVTVTPMGLGGLAANDAYGHPQSVRVRVTVACTNGALPVMLESFRVRYAPNRT